MTIPERACQIWAVLAWASRGQQTMTYKQLGDAIGVPAPGLGQLLDPILAYCEANALPPMTVIVVGKDGMPGVGFPAAQPAEVLRRQREVFSTDWLAHGNPGPAAFQAVNG